MARRWFGIALLTLAFGTDAEAARPWAAYTSDNFTIYSDAREDDAIELTRNLEEFRRICLDFLDLPDRPENERLIILVLGRVRDYYRIKPDGVISGFFYHSVYGPRMIVGPNGRLARTRSVLFHEYVHYLLHRHSVTNYPRWLSEGLATLLGASRFEDDGVVVGKPPVTYARALWTGIGTDIYSAIDLEPDGYQGAFYLTSWLMTHYFLVEPDNGGDRRLQTVDYIRRFDSGEDPARAFEASYGATLLDMQNEIDSFRRRRKIVGLTLPRPRYPGDVSRRPLQPGEDLFLLGDIATELGNADVARDYFDRFDARVVDSPFEVRVISKRAIALVREGRIEEGDALIDRVLARDPESAEVLTDIAHYAFDRYVYHRDRLGRPDPESLSRSIDYAGRAVAAAPEDLEALYYLGVAHEANGDVQAAAEVLLRSYALNPSVPRLNGSLLRVLIEGQRNEAASRLLSRLYSASQSRAIRSKIRALKRAIDGATFGSERFEPRL